MNYLLDTNVFLFASSQPKRLSKKIMSALITPDSKLYLSVCSLWEITIKASLKRLKFSPTQMKTGVEDLGAEILNISIEDLEILSKLPPLHADPFDRMIISQALASGLTVLTSDEKFRDYPKLKTII